MSKRESGVAHHFEDAQQQRVTAHFGMWLFLATEVLFFGAVFTAYTVYRVTYPQAFDEAARHTNVLLGSLNTAVLLTSSLTMALAVQAAKGGKQKTLFWLLLSTGLLGTVFLGVKAIEYYEDYQDRLVPAINFYLPISQPAQGELFFVLYFIMTLIHAFHLIIGIGIIAYMTIRTWHHGFSVRYHTPIEITGLYWHFVDIVWVFLFPMLYLINRA